MNSISGVEEPAFWARRVNLPPGCPPPCQRATLAYSRLHTPPGFFIPEWQAVPPQPRVPASAADDREMQSRRRRQLYALDRDRCVIFQVTASLVFQFLEVAVVADFSPGPGCFRPIGAAFASQRGHVRSAGAPEDRFFQIEGHGIEQELQFDLGQTEVTGSKEAVATLEGAEGALHL